MKKVLILLLGLMIIIGAAACSAGSGTEESGGEPAPDETKAAHTIAVLVYDRTDEEVLSFRHYLEEYIAKEFDVEFLYSDSISTQDEALKFISDAADYGAEGVMSFNSYDLKTEVDLCADKGMYFMMASGTVTDEAYEAVADNKAFLGVVGPGDETEYMAGANLVEHALIEDEDEDKDHKYFIMSGGAAIGNEMHRLRTVGAVEKLISAYGVKFDKTSEEIAATSEPLVLESEGLTICVCPGYPGMDGMDEKVREAFGDGDYESVLGVLPLTKFMDTFRGAKIGVVDCYSESNMIAFNAGALSYVTGKYSSIIGPSFAAMYNAVTGYADDFRFDGKAFRIKQGFWSSDNREDYEEKYSLASSIEKVAYNYEDLQEVIKEFNPDASLADLMALAEAYTYEDALARRAE